jgi:hypothetical protein
MSGSDAPVSPLTDIPKGDWQGYGEYTGPNGEMVLYQPSLKRLLARNRPAAVPLRPLQEGEKPPPKVPASDTHPHTQEKPGTAKPSAPPNTSPPEPTGGGSDDVDEEMRRHQEWLRHRFDPPSPPPPPDRSKPGTYQRMRDEADETARRVRALEQERYDSPLPDWLWDQLFGQELRILLVHLRALRWQIEEFEKAYRKGDDPVEAVNRYNREQWRIFLEALYEHLQLLGLALTGIDAIRGFQQAMEEALQAAQASRRRQAGDWLRTRERARQNARSQGGGPGEGGEPGGGGGGGPRATDPTRPGGFSRRDWRRIRIKKIIDDFPDGDPRRVSESAKMKQEFPTDEGDVDQYGETVFVVTMSEDGSTVTVVQWQMSPDGVISYAEVETIPASEMPDNFLQPGESYGSAFTNEGPR